MEKALIVGIILVTDTILCGITLAVLWGWFIAGPQAPFASLPELTVLEALGLSLVVAFLTHQPRQSDRKRDFSTMLREEALLSFGGYAWVWIIAVIVHAMQG